MRWWQGCGRGESASGAMASAHGRGEACGGDVGSGPPLRRNRETEEGMDGRGLDGSRDTLLCVEQLAKVIGRARRVKDTRR
jgi:hypothetical protein